MITAKFGGSSVTAQNLRDVKHLAENCGCIVVSAIGKEWFGDEKVTDLLAKHFHGEPTWELIACKYRKMAEVNGIQTDIDRLLFDAQARSKKFNLDYCLSLGEELSAKLVANFLKCPYIEAEDCVRFKNGKLLWRATQNNLKSVFRGVKKGVIGGFYGGSDGGERTVFSRGGGDVSGAVCAVATESSIYENFTDVNGVCVANPRKIFGAETIPELSYSQMYTLSRCGAEVLHPEAVRISQKFGIPICVRNTFNSAAPSTIVGNRPSLRRFLSVTEKQRDIIVTTVLHSMDFDEIFARLSKLKNILRCSVFPNIVEITSKTSILKDVYEAFST